MRLIAIVALGLFPAYAFAHGAENRQTSTAPTDTALAQAEETVELFHAALAKGDRATAEALLDDNVRIYEQGWVERSKAEYASHHLASDIAFSKATKRTQTTRSGVALGDLATVASEGTVAGTFEGKAINAISLETMVMRRTRDKWRIVHIHWSSRDAKK